MRDPDIHIRLLPRLRCEGLVFHRRGGVRAHPAVEVVAVASLVLGYGRGGGFERAHDFSLLRFVISK